MHYFIVHMCGLHSGTPSPALERGHQRALPEVFRADCNCSTALHYIPEVAEYNAARSVNPFDGTRIKLSPLLVMLCMPVERLLLLFGAVLFLCVGLYDTCSSVVRTAVVLACTTLGRG